MKCKSCYMHNVYIHPQSKLCPSCVWKNENMEWKPILKEIAAVSKKYHICIYCGERATDIEHVIPKHLGMPTFTVKSCRECNLLAGAFVFTGFADKLLFIKNKLSDVIKRF